MIAPRRTLLALAWLATAALLSTPSASASSSVTVGASAAAWYSPPPTCALPSGCGPTDALPATSTYPAGTLHVGVRAGVEEARTYLKLDLASIPSGAHLTGATLTLPIAPSGAGTSDPPSAKMVACWVPRPFNPVSGSFAPPPAVDCGTTAPAVLAAEPPARFTLNLAVFAARWGSGDPINGLALLPASTQAAGATWHVAFFGPDYDGGSPPTAQISFEPPAPVASGSSESPASSPAEAPVSSGIGSLVERAAPIFAPPAASAAPIVEAAKHPAVVRPSPRSQLVVQSFPRFSYPVVMGLPLVLLLLGSYLGRVLTQPLDPIDPLG